MSEKNEGLRPAEERLEEAAAELDRQQLTAMLCEKEGLAYASMTEDRLGPMLVTYQHKPIGQTHTTSPSALKDWYAQPYLKDGSLGENRGPFVNARAAAAALIPDRGSAQPGSDDVG